MLEKVQTDRPTCQAIQSTVRNRSAYSFETVVAAAVVTMSPSGAAYEREG